jgi:predicted phage terminase large subunit-like protein
LTANPPLTSKQLRMLQLTGTPAGFAQIASRGRYALAPHLLLINHKLVQLATGRIKRLIIQCPPRHGKSELCSKYFPAWFLGTFPDRRFGTVSYESGFAASWGEKARNLLTEWGPALFGVRVSRNTSARDNWNIAGHLGGMNTAGVGGPLTGRGFHVLGIDDPVKNAEEALSLTTQEAHWDWWNSTALTRLEPGGVVFVMMTRWHEDDLIGRILKRAGESGEQWDVVSLPALAGESDLLGRQPGKPLWPARYPKSVLENTRKNLDLFWWNALYQQTPGQHGRTEWPGSYFPDSIWAPAGASPLQRLNRVVVLDPSKGREAKRGDYSAIVGTFTSGGKIHVRSDIRRRPVPEMIGDLIDFAREFGAEAVGIESNQFQDLLLPEIQRQCEERNLPPLPLYTIENRVNKTIRIRRIGPYLSRGELLFEDAASNRLLVEQLKEFDLGKHDDGPDALEMSIRLTLELNGITVSDNVLGHNLLEHLT